MEVKGKPMTKCTSCNGTIEWEEWHWVINGKTVCKDCYE